MVYNQKPREHFLDPPPEDPNYEKLAAKIKEAVGI